MLTLIAENRKTKRGKIIYTIDLAKNGIQQLDSEFCDLLYGRKVFIRLIFVISRVIIVDIADTTEDKVKLIVEHIDRIGQYVNRRRRIIT